MGKLRTRVKGSKGKRWPKGHSSSSNPTISKHRDAAKNNFFQPFLSNKNPDTQGNSGLTEEALKQHTYASYSIPKSGAPSEIMTSAPSVVSGDFDDDTMSMKSGTSFRSGFSDKSASSYKTFATVFSNCSNMSFNKLFRGYTPKSAFHNDMLAVLSASTEAIKEMGGKETDTEYFGALLTSMENPDITEEVLSATVCLLSMTIKKVPSNVLKLQFPSSSKCLLELLGHHVESDNSILVRSLIGCLGVLLRNQSAPVWSNSSTLQIYDALLSYVANPKPKVRKAAQHAISSILKGSPLLTEGEDPPQLHPVATHTAKFCLAFLEEHISDKDPAPVLHFLNLLKETFSALPQNEVKSLSEALLKLISLSNVLITSCAMQSFYGLLHSRPKPVTLSAELNARLLTALYDYQPSLNDTQPLRVWTKVMTEAHLNLGRMDPVLCAGHLPRMFSVTTQFWASDRYEIIQAVNPSLSSLLSQCLGPAITLDPTVRSSAEKIVVCVEQCLGFQYVKAWKYVISLSTSLMEVVGKSEPSLLTKLIQTLAGLRGSTSFAYETEVDYTFGKAVRVCGPRFVLKSIPLNISGNEDSYDYPNSWLIPILRENISHTELTFFFEYFYPLAEKCRERAARFKANNNQVGFRVLDQLQRQFWGLLPGFCKYPVDVDKSFSSIARLLGDAILGRDDIRMDVIAALRQLLIHSKNDPKIRNEISKYSKNYLPLLFNRYMEKPTQANFIQMEAQRQSVYQTICQFLPVSDATTLSGNFDKAFDMLTAAIEKMTTLDGSKPKEELVFEWEAILDLLRALVTYQEDKRVEKLVHVCLKWLLGDDHKAQKKAYRIVEEIINAETDICREYVRENMGRIVKLFNQTAAATLPTSKASRLRSLNRICSMMDAMPNQDYKSFVGTVIDEAVPGVKDVREKVKSAAIELLITIGHVQLKWSAEKPQEAMRDYLAQLMKGIEGEDLMISAIITSVTYVVREFACHCTEELVTSLFECVCEMMVSTSSRDVVLSCLNFVRMFIVTLHSQRLPMYLKRLVCCMSAIDEEFQRSFRIKTRDIYICLMRKCGAELIMKLAPEEDGILLKRLNNIRKAEARKKKQRDQTSQDKDNEEDEEEEVMATQPKTIEHVLADSDDEDDWDEKDVKDPKKRTVKTWIQEDESSIVDFLDPSAAKKVTATNPRLLPQSVEAKKKKQQNMFKTAADGRMIIEEGSDSDSSDESDGGISDAMGSMKVCRKRQLEDTESNLDQEESSFKYQAGGSGIHRPVAAAKEQGAGGAIRKVTKLTAKMRARQSGEKVKNADYGAEFRSSKARGDVKRKGQQHEPFAYVPLSKSVLNKRKVKKQQGQYKSIFAAAKKGAAAGIKQRGKVIAKKE